MLDQKTEPGDEIRSGQKHRFIKNNQYFTICVYAFLLVVASTIAIKAIVSFASTRAFLAGLFRAVSPFLIALLIAYVLTPFVTVVHKLLSRVFRIRSDKVRLVISILVVYSIALGLLVALMIYILPEVVKNIADLVNYVPTGYEELKELLLEIQERFPTVNLSSVINMLENTQADVITGLQDIAGRVIPVLYTASVSIVTWLGNFLIAIVVSVYMMYGKKPLLRILKIILAAVFSQEQLPVVKEILRDCNRIFSQFVVGKMIDSLIIGILCSILMTILHLPYVFLVSVFVGVTNMIPYFGPFIGAIPGVVIMLVINPIQSLIFAIMILCLQQFDGLWLGPKLLGSSTGMKPIWIIFAITIGGKFFGVLGMFLGVPVVAIIAYLGERYMRYRLAQKDIRLEDIQ